MPMRTGNKADPNIIAKEIRSEIRRAIRKHNELSQPLRLFRPTEARPEGHPRYQVCFDLGPREPTGAGLRYSCAEVARPDERLEDLVYDFARSVWHLHDRLHQWAKAKHLLLSRPRRIMDHARNCKELLIAADLINRKKHGANENLSGARSGGGRRCR